MDEDDLPPQPGAPQELTAAGSMGWWVGTLAWLGLFVIVVGGVLYAVTHWSH